MKLAIDGGPPVRRMPFPPRRLFRAEEKCAAGRVFDAAIASGEAFRYGGGETLAYERELTSFQGGGHAVLVSSGTAALYVALTALELEVPGEVVVPAITDPGGMMPIPLRNLVPVVADTAPGSFAIGAAQVEPLLSPWTRAIVVAHIGGEPAVLEPLTALAKKRGVYLIEDCSQAHGALAAGRLAGTIGDVAVFSTMSGKHHATGGQGGVVFTRREELVGPLRRAADRGKPIGLDREDNVVASLNFNSTELSAAIGRVQLAKLERTLALRREVVVELARAIAGFRSVRIAWRGALGEPAWWFLRLELELEGSSATREWFIAALRAEGLPIGTWADQPHRQRWFTERAVFPGSALPWTLPEYRGAHRDTVFECPNAAAAAATHAALFIHERWTAAEIADVRAALEKVEDATFR